MEKVENIVITLARLANASEEQAKKLIEAYSQMSDIEIIKDLSLISYRTFSSNEGFYTYALTLIRGINPLKCPPVNEMKKILKKHFTSEIRENENLEENHNLVINTLTDFVTLFNEAGIDYYIVGALPCFIKTGEKLFRYHDDIHIMINENDIERLKELLELCAYDFYDDRFPTIERYYEMQQRDTPYKIIAKNKKNDFHIDFSCFRRELDQSITLREYIHRIENGKVAVDVLEKRTTPEGTKLRFDDITTEYMNASFKTGTVEYMYHIKSSTKRQKDINDMKKIEPYIDKEKLKRIINNPPQEVTIKNITEPESIKMNKN